MPAPQAAGGKQLLCEAVGLLGSLLLALDRRLQSPVRERLIVAYYRLRGGSQAVGRSANAVIALCASTGLDAARKRSPPGICLESITGCLRISVHCLWRHALPFLVIQSHWQ